MPLLSGISGSTFNSEGTAAWPRVVFALAHGVDRLGHVRHDVKAIKDDLVIGVL
jgi:hypothetical protein